MFHPLKTRLEKMFRTEPPLNILRNLLTAILGLTAIGAEAGEPLRRFEFAQIEMAVEFKLVFYFDDPAVATRAAKAAFDRVHQLNSIMSDYDENSELRRLCDTATDGNATPVSEDLWAVVAAAQAMAARSDGAFDITVGPVVRLWRWARRHHEMPPSFKIEAARQLVDYRLVHLNSERKTISLGKPNMRLDLGGIAKGYATAQALAVLERHGIHSAMVHAGGDMALGDPPPDAPGWRIAVAPLEPGQPPSQFLSLSRCSVAASGDTWQYVTIDGKRYSHIVNPKTGLGLTEHATVTLVAPDGLTADAMATAVNVLGPEQGLKLVEETPGAAAHILRVHADKPEVFQSSRWKELPIAPANSDRR